MAKQQAKGPSMPPHLSVTASDGTNLIPGAVIVAETKTFKSGKEGYWGQGRWLIGGRRYMAQIQVVEITNGDSE